MTSARAKMLDGVTPWEPLDSTEWWGFGPPTILAPFRLLLAIPLIFVRFFLVFFTIMFMWGYCKLFLIGATLPFEPDDPPIAKWRSLPIRLLARLAARWLLFVFGFVWLETKSFEKKRTSNLTVCNHLGVIEILYLIYTDAPSFIARKGVLDYPIVGAVTAAMQTIYVDRARPDSRKRTAAALAYRAERLEYPPVMLFPEGTTTNGAFVLTLQTGVFRVGVPVRVISVKSLNKRIPTCWAKGGLARHLFRVMAQPINRLRLITLDTHVPSQEEIEDPKLFARNVQQDMAAACDAEVSPFTCYDSPMLANIRNKTKATPGDAAEDALTEEREWGLTDVEIERGWMSIELMMDEAEHSLSIIETKSKSMGMEEAKSEFEREGHQMTLDQINSVTARYWASRTSCMDMVAPE